MHACPRLALENFLGLWAHATTQATSSDFTAMGRLQLRSRQWLTTKR